VSQIYGWNGTSKVEIDFGVDAPIYGWDGTKKILLNGVIDVPVDPTPPAFDSLPSLELFMDAADPAGTGTAPADNAPVASWAAKQGNVTFTSPTDGPIFYAPTATEPAFLRFDGATRAVADLSRIPTSGPFTVYVVGRAHHLGYGCIFSAGNQDAATFNPSFALDFDGYGRTRALRRTDDGALTLAQQNLLANSWRVYSVTSSSYNEIALRGNEQLSAAVANKPAQTGVATLNRMAIGARVSPNGTDAFNSSWAGDIAALLVYSEAHDATTRAAVEKQLATRSKVVLPSQGGTIDGSYTRRVDHMRQLSIEYGIPDKHRVTGRTLPAFHNRGVDPTLQSTDFEPINGTFTTTGDGQVVSKKWITGNVVVKHAGVVFQDCILASTVDPKLDTRGAPTVSDLPFVTINRCEVFGKEEDSSTAIGYIRYTVTNSFLHDSEDTARLNKSTVIEDNLMAIHSDGYLPDGSRLHTDCVQANGGDNAAGERSLVRYNTLIAFRHNRTKGNSAVILATEGASVNGINQGSPLRHVTVEGNYMAGGSYTLYIKTPGTGGSPGPMEDILVKDNVFRGPKPTTPATLASGISSDDLPDGAFYRYGDAWIPYASLADTFLTMTGNVREDGSAIKITRSTLGGGEGENTPPATTTPATGANTPQSVGVPKRGFWSGGSGEGIDNGSTAFGTWRGDPVDYMSTWIDAANGAVWTQGIAATGGPTGPAAGFTGLLNIAIGGPSDWQAASNGSMDTQVTSLAQRLRSNRTLGGVVRPTIIRAAHEWNSGYDWKIETPAEAVYAKATLAKWGQIFKQYFPEAMWELCQNGENVGSSVKPRDLWTAGVHTILGADRYNQYAHIGNSDESPSVFRSFDSESSKGSTDYPIGLYKHLALAAELGVPLDLPEYASNMYDPGTPSNAGESVYYWGQVYAWFQANAGSGPGKLYSESLFNQIKDQNRWILFRQDGVPIVNPADAAKYQSIHQSLPR
jgi:hypothetical protein